MVPVFTRSTCDADTNEDSHTCEDREGGGLGVASVQHGDPAKEENPKHTAGL